LAKDFEELWYSVLETYAFMRPFYVLKKV
jgi:hypothetical protein